VLGLIALHILLICNMISFMLYISRC